jgi:hypothetical protein
MHPTRRAQMPRSQPTPNVEAAAAHLLRFPSLFAEGRGLAFPCDPAGRVDVDRLSDRARHNYLYARAMCGREFGTPQIQRAESTSVPAWRRDGLVPPSSNQETM